MVLFPVKNTGSYQVNLVLIKLPVAVSDPVVNVPVEQTLEIEGIHHGIIEFMHPGADEAFQAAAAYVAFAL